MVSDLHEKVRMRSNFQNVRADFIDRAAITLADLVSAFARLTPDSQKRAAICFDIALCIVGTWVAFALRLGIVKVNFSAFLLVCLVSGLIWALVAHRLRFYASLLRYAGGRTMLDLIWAAAVMGLSMSVLFALIEYPHLPRTMGVLQPMTFIGLIGISRLFVRFMLVEFAPRDGNEHSVLIYGAGRAGQQLTLSLRHERNIKVVGYLDDDPRLIGQRIDGVPIHDPARLSELLHVRPVGEILLALPTATRERRRQIIETIQAFDIHVRSLPTASDILSGEVTFDDLREVDIEDLLGRDAIPANVMLLEKNIRDKVVLVTGAGGSIGSELSRQILRIGPSKLVLLDRSEFSLYSIGEELRKIARRSKAEIPTLVLGDVTDEGFVQRTMSAIKPQTVFHVAAYKHVPLVEDNVISGVFNNVMGTLNCCKAAEDNATESFVLVSTDKAVRPTNVMGASKRVCELIVEARGNRQSSTIFSMVRFGNVLGSSGSVVPLFKEQIRLGGPLTLTDREVTRYFMTIPEAAQLVIQSASLAKGGDVFVLDMGEPVKIIDLAETLIHLSGRTVRSIANPEGDIEIVETGLRPGEKAYEELFLGDRTESTPHPRIMRAKDRHSTWAEIEPGLESLVRACAGGDVSTVLQVLEDLVEGFCRAKLEKKNCDHRSLKGISSLKIV